MKQQILVVGLGRFGASIARSLSALGQEVMGLDTRADLVEDVKADLTYAAQGDATDEQVLRAIEVTQFDAAVVAVGENFEASVLATHALKRAGVSYVLARASNAEQSRILSLVGADRVAFLEVDVGRLTAFQLVNRHLLSFMRLDDRTHVAAVRVGDWSFRSVHDVERTCGLTTLGVFRGGRIRPADPDAPLDDGDTLVLAGDLSGLQTLARM